MNVLVVVLGRWDDAQGFLSAQRMGALVPEQREVLEEMWLELHRRGFKIAPSEEIARIAWDFHPRGDDLHEPETDGEVKTYNAAVELAGQLSLLCQLAIVKELM